MDSGKYKLTDKDKENNGWLVNCIVEPKEDADCKYGMFTKDENDNVIARLDGYAIIPREKYEALLAKSVKDGE